MAVFGFSKCVSRSKYGSVAPLLAASLMAAQLCAVNAHADTVYAVDTTITSANPTGNPLQTDSVVGSITTDGTIGVIGPGNVLGWNLDLIDRLNSANNFTLTTANSSLVEDVGGTLSATSKGLFFDFSGSGEFLIQVHAYSGSNYFCFSTGYYACLAGQTIAPQSVFLDGVVATGLAAPVGMQPLNQIAPVPEPATVSLFCLGLAGVGLMRRRKTS